ncbi:hypothetical protein ACM39_03500 [Chryseobacterium sp. FH2]|uniref:hypothetical protein n=1 Tax=Chryseobacterium sp. FH2 TaxID=1674291 RepID=UPI00065AFEB3|nr:hypothetical protein [Chryseobacterium sp. FH2]KMQ69185.1 hypothetical protein ACM39_03500 [Chryseobacterium sp. FH2]
MLLRYAFSECTPGNVYPPVTWSQHLQEDVKHDNGIAFRVCLSMLVSCIIDFLEIRHFTISGLRGVFISAEKYTLYPSLKIIRIGNHLILL